MDDLQRRIGDMTAAATLAAIDSAAPDERDRLLAAVRAHDVQVRRDGHERVVVVGGTELARISILALDQSGGRLQ